MRASYARAVWLVLALGAVLGATLFPVRGGELGGWIACVICGDRAIADIILNVTLFAPLGGALALQGWPRTRCIMAAALLSASIEYAQLFIPGRDSSLSDVASNTVGAAVGFAAVAAAHLWLTPTRRRAAVLSLAAAGGATFAFVLTGVLLTPSFPASPYFGEWTPSLAGLEWYRGHVLRATAGGLPIGSGELANSSLIRSRLSADSGVAIEVRATAGPPTVALSAILRVADAEGREILLLGPDRGALVFRFRMRAADLRLDEPDLRLPGAMERLARGDTLEVTVSGGRGRYCMAVHGAGACDVGFTVASGWALLFYPESMPTWLDVLLRLAWMGGLLLPAGFWAPGRGVALVAASVATAGLVVTPLVAPVLPPRPADWIAAAVGLLLGAMAGRAVRRTQGDRPITLVSLTT